MVLQLTLRGPTICRGPLYLCGTFSSLMLNKTRKVAKRYRLQRVDDNSIFQYACISVQKDRQTKSLKQLFRFRILHGSPKLNKRDYSGIFCATLSGGQSDYPYLQCLQSKSFCSRTQRTFYNLDMKYFVKVRFSALFCTIDFENATNLHFLSYTAVLKTLHTVTK